MIKQITAVPDNMVAFSAEGDVTADDFNTTVLPAVHALVERTGKLNYLMIINTSLSNFSAGAWWKDMMLGIQQLTKWERVAIVSDSTTLNAFTDIFSVIVPGVFKGFLPSETDIAIDWVSGIKQD